MVVTFNNLALNRQCLESVYGRTEWPNLEVIVVDNASEDGTPDYLAEAQREFPTLHVVLNDSNEGFARANNVGLARSGGDFLVLLNNDTVVTRGWLASLVRHLHRDSTLGMVGPVSNAVGNEAQIDVGYRDIADMQAWAADYVREHDGESFDIPMLAMFCVAMRRDVFEKVGPLDERFEVGMFEDDDYARRVRQAGYRIECVRDSFVHHWQKASFRLLGEPEYLKLYHRNRCRFDEKWGEKPRPRAVVASPAGLEVLYDAAETARGVVVFPPSVGWGIHLFQRPHHLARSLAGLGYVVVFDCSNAYDDVARLRELEPRLFLYRGSPEDLHHLHEPIVWTFPYNFHFAEAFPYGARTVYDWIDDLSVFTAWDQDLVRRNHARALEKATVVATVARPLLDEARRTRPDALYLPNAVDYDHFADLPERVRDPKLASLHEGRPVAGYYGALARWFDDEMLDETAAKRPGLELRPRRTDVRGRPAGRTIAQAPERDLDGTEGLPDPARLRGLVRRSAHPLPPERDHAGDLAAEAVRVLRRRPTGRLHGLARMRGLPGGPHRPHRVGAVRGARRRPGRCPEPAIRREAASNRPPELLAGARRGGAGLLGWGRLNSRRESVAARSDLLGQPRSRPSPLPDPPAVQPPRVDPNVMRCWTGPTPANPQALR